jgi:aryl-alcohol dehydrogenase-like predicted oxidoreductase
LAAHLPADVGPAEAAVRFALSHPAVTSAIVGFGRPEEVSEVVGFAMRGPLDAALLGRLEAVAVRSAGGET